MRLSFPYLLANLLCCLFLPAVAQQPHFQLHNLPAPLRDLPITTLYQAPGDFLWLGTEGGLLRYDGENALRLLRPDSLAEDHVTSLYRDQQDQLWVGYQDGGIFQYDPFAGLQAWEFIGPGPEAPIAGFAEDHRGQFWIATYGAGLYYVRQQKLHSVNAAADPADADIYTLTSDAHGRIWTGTDAGIAIYQLEDDKVQRQRIGREEGLPDEIVRVILPDAAGNCWVGTHDRGFGLIDGTTHQITYWFSDWQQGVINSLLWVAPDQLWIGTDDRGLWRYFPQDSLLSPIAASALTAARIKDLTQDEEGNLWVVSGADHLWSASLLFEFMEAELQQVQALLVDRQGQLWAGTPHGLYRQAAGLPGRDTFVRILKGNYLSLYEDDRGVIWAGTFGEGVVLYHLQTGHHRLIDESDGLSNGSILSIAGNSESIWLATLGGATEIKLPVWFERPAIRNYQHADGLGPNFIYKVFVDRRHRVWFGTDGEGVSILREKKLERLQLTDSLLVNAVYTIAEDQQGDIWLGTAQAGIFRCRDQTCIRVVDQSGLQNSNIAGLQADHHGCILLIYPSGIQVLDPTDGSRRYYDQEVGIEGWEPNLNASYPAADGRIWIGTQRGIFAYSGKLAVNRTRPRAHLTGMSVNLQSVDTAQAVSLTYQRNNIAFDYIGLWYTSPGSVRYRYRLQGLDQDWIYSRDRRAVYSQLPPGDYTFELSAAHQDQHFPPAQVSFSFSIVAPLWQRSWFVGLLFVAGAAVLFWVIRLRENRLERQAMLRREKLAAQFELLKSQINPHFLFNNFNTLVTLIEENPGLAVDYVERLADFYRSILQYRERTAIHLEEELALLRNYAFLLKERFADNLCFDIGDSTEDTYILPLTLQLLVENAIKHNVVSKDRPLSIQVCSANGYVEVRNKLQLKLRPEPSTGFGLQSVIDRYAALTDRQVIVEAGPEDFVVRIPWLPSPGRP